MQAWLPSNKHIAVDTACFKEYIDTREIQEENEEGEDKPKSIFDREDVFKDPLEDKD